MRVTIDPAKTFEPVRENWLMGVNTCHAALLTRSDLCHHLRIAREVGFRYVRFHNIFSEQVGLLSVTDEGASRYDFTRFDQIYDNVLKTGLLPFFELSLCPPALKSGDSVLTHYRANTSVPESMERWSDLVRTVAEHVVQRYGIDCVADWYFEVWNEPDILFWAGTQDQYFDLYDHSAVALKSVSERLRVGGPATSKCAWIDEFIRHAEHGSEVTDFQPVPCDFVSTHAYPSDVAFLDSAEGPAELQPSTIMRDLFTEVRRKMDGSSLRDLPLFMGEWNSSAGPYATNHDDRNNAAFIAKTLVELHDVIDGSLYWNLSDIYEEGGFHYTPFHGGYGLVNVNSIPKSSFNAFAMLSKITGHRVAVDTGAAPYGCGAFAAYDDAEAALRILLYYHDEPDADGANSWEVVVDPAGGGRSAVPTRVTRVCATGGSPYELWRELGSPDYLTLQTHQALIRQARPAISEHLVGKDVQSESDIALRLEPGDLVLVECRVTWRRDGSTR